MHVSIEDQNVEERSGTSSNGKPYHMRYQFGYATMPGDKYPKKVKINLPDNESAYPMGDYILSDESFMVAQFDELKLGRYIKLKALEGKK